MTNLPDAGGAGGARRMRAPRGCGRVLRRARALAALVLPRPRQRGRRRGQPPSRQARHRRPRRRARRRSPTPGFRPARRRATKSPDAGGTGHQLPPGGDPRAAPGHRRAVPGLLARPRRDPAAGARLGHPPERRLLPRLPGRDAPGDRARAPRLLLGGLEAHRPRHRALAARARDPRRRQSTPGSGWLLVVGTIPVGPHRAAGREVAAQRVRLAGERRRLPVPQRGHAAAAPSACGAAWWRPTAAARTSGCRG